MPDSDDAAARRAEQRRQAERLEQERKAKGTHNIIILLLIGGLLVWGGFASEGRSGLGFLLGAAMWGCAYWLSTNPPS